MEEFYGEAEQVIKINKTDVSMILKALKQQDSLFMKSFYIAIDAVTEKEHP